MVLHHIVNTDHLRLRLSTCCTQLIEISIVVSTLMCLAYMIAPFVSWTMAFPISTIVTIAASIGLVVIALDLAVNKAQVLRGRHSWLLFLMLGLSIFASIRMSAYGAQKNISTIAATCAMCTLFYSYAKRVGLSRAQKMMKILFYLAAGLWLAACIVSILTYLYNVGYLEQTSLDPTRNWTPQGFTDHRVFGVFMALNLATNVSAILLIGSIYLLIHERSGSDSRSNSCRTSRSNSRLCTAAKKTFLLISAIVFFSMIILSGTRSALVALISAAAASGAYWGYWQISKASNKNRTTPVKHQLPSQHRHITGSSRRLICATLGAFLCVTVTCTGMWTTREILSRVPELPIFAHSQASFREFLETSAPKLGISIAINEPTTDTDANAQREHLNTEEHVEADHIDAHTREEKSKERTNILERPDVTSEDISNNRFAIWKDYLGLWREIGLIGLSPGNYRAYISDHHPDLYIAEHIHAEYSATHNANAVYHPHNIFLFTWVSSGLIGAAALIIFLLWCFVDCIRYAHRHGKYNPLFGVLFSIVLACVVFAMFEVGLVYKNNGVTAIFWLLAGVLMEISTGGVQKNRKITSPHLSAKMI